MKNITINLTEKEVALICALMAHGSVYLAMDKEKWEGAMDMVLQAKEVVDKLYLLMWLERADEYHQKNPDLI